MKKIIVDLPDEIHAELKAEIALRNTSIKKFVMRAIFELLEKTNPDKQK